MKKTLWQTVMPHVVAVAIFLVLALIISKPALESGVVMKQSDIAGWQGMSHQLMQYKEQHGHFPLWLTNMFSGMPAYQVAMEGPWTINGVLHTILQFGLPKPINFFFLACICFYFLCQCLRVRPWVSVIAAVAYAYSSFNPIIITAGHDTQILALAYAPAVIGSVILLYNRHYIAGVVAMALFTSMQVAMGHQQVSYYMFLVIGIMSVFYLADAISKKETAPFLKGAGLAIAGAIIGLAINAVTLMTVYDYSKESKRGGQLVLNKNQAGDNKVSNDKTKGLSKEYAFQWSYGWGESLSLMFPGIKGYGMHGSERDGEQYIFPRLEENSHVGTYLSEKLNAPADQAANFSSSLYWGDQEMGTNGPVYLGAVVCALFIFAMFFIEKPHKWWILTAAILGVLMALGKHFPAFNNFLFDYFPLYNKFRVPTMALVIPQMVVPIGVALGLEKLITTQAIDLKKLRMAGIVTAAIFVFAALLYFTYDYSNENKKRMSAFNQAIAQGHFTQATYDSLNNAYPMYSDNRFYENLVLFQLKGNTEVAKGILTAVREDRQSAFGSTLMRSLLFVLLTGALIYLYATRKVNMTIMLVGVGLLTAIDLLSFDSHYLNNFSFDSKEKYEASEFPLTAADQEILKDTDPNYRVFNESGGDESRTSYYHKSIGGYHPAKLGIYDDLTQYQLSRDPNPMVLNMLNAKYIIHETQQGATVERNPGALGNVWFVKEVKYVKGPAEEMLALNNFNPRETAIVEEAFKSKIPAFTPADSSAAIKQVAFDNDDIKYESNSSSAHLAVFSEIYYKDWKAYVDGQPADFVKANYVLRAMVVPAGKHTIEFKFEPKVYYTGSTITRISNIILVLLLLGFVALQVKPLIDKKKAAV
jgi:hypothetical protein